MNEKVREDFPLLKRTLDGKPVVYLDSAATALKPHTVLEAERRYSTEFTANVHRGKHALSEEASAAYEGARRRVARFLSADPEAVVFVKNTTEALNLVASGLGLSRGDRVLAPVGEHHSNLVPWMRRASLVVLEADPRKPLDLDLFEEALLRERPRVVALGHASNLTGAVNPVAEAAKLAHRHGALLVVDAAQSAPHLRVDVERLGCDFLAFSGHKLLGPTGVGVLWGRPELLEKLEPLSPGGGTVERVTQSGFEWKKVPYRFEGGTPNVSGVLGLAAAVEYLSEVGFEALTRHEKVLADALGSALDGLPGAEVLMAAGEPRLAIACVAPRSDKVNPDRLALQLSDSFQVMVRSGFHCAHPAFDFWKLPWGAVRASAYLYNTVEEVAAFGAALRSLLGRFTA